MPDTDNTLWGGDYKIPWNDPEFSRRMLREHLSQAHDLASRRTEWIDQQVAWIHAEILHRQPARLLDLGCGPGFYAHRLARLGHQCLGLDFGPASIDYAQEHTPADTACDFLLADLRSASFQGPHDLALLLYGELNVFSPTEAKALLRKAQQCLTANGRLLLEVQTPAAVEETGRAAPTDQQSESGLFSDNPHRCHTESRWLEAQRVALQTFTITPLDGGPAQVYRNTTQSWSDEDLRALLQEVGFTAAGPCAAWPNNTPALTLWIATNA